MVLRKAKVLDSTHLELSEPIATPSGETVLISVAVARENDVERAEWLAASLQSLNDAYGESEPEYSPTMVRERNPDYRGHSLGVPRRPAD